MHTAPERKPSCHHGGWQPPCEEVTAAVAAEPSMRAIMTVLHNDRFTDRQTVGSLSRMPKLSGHNAAIAWLASEPVPSTLRHSKVTVEVLATVAVAASQTLQQWLTQPFTSLAREVLAVAKQHCAGPSTLKQDLCSMPAVIQLHQNRPTHGLLIKVLYKETRLSC
jgi:hypothetical protein